MKYLMKDSNGLYNKDGIIINTKKDNLSIYNLILKYGFNLNEITDKKNLINKVLISTGVSTSTIKYDNQEAYIIINKDDGYGDNIKFNGSFSVLVSGNGKMWRSMLSSDYYLEKEFNINLVTLDESKMTFEESNELIKMKMFINKYSKPVKIIKNDNFIKYIFIKLNTTDELASVNTIMNLKNGSLKKDDNIQVNYNNNNITITNNRGRLIKTLNVNLNTSEYIKDTISEF